MNVITEIYNKDLRNKKFLYICGIICFCLLLVSLVLRDHKDFRDQIYNIQRNQGTILTGDNLRDIKKIQDKKRKDAAKLYHKLSKEDNFRTDFTADYELLRLAYRYKDQELIEKIHLTSQNDRLYYINRDRASYRRVQIM